MSVTSMKTNDDKRVELAIKVDAETFEKAVDAAFKRNSKRMNVPGFRRGKAPRKMIERLYGEGVFYEEAVNNTYPVAYEDAVKEKGIEPKAMGVEVISDAILAKGVAAAAKFNFDNTVKVLQEGWPEAMPEK